MVEKAVGAAGPSERTARGPGGAVPVVATIYAITALHYEGQQISEVMMGLVDTRLARWDLSPAPTRLVEVVDRLVEGDTVITLFRDEEGLLQPGPQVKVDVLPEGAETLALVDDAPGRRLSDLPRF